MVKLAFEMSKKTLPTDSTLILAALVGEFGSTTLSVPSFGVLADRTRGNVLPPSVESEILTFAQLTGALVVFATFQLTDWEEPPGQDTAVFGCVTVNGPALETTLT